MECPSCGAEVTGRFCSYCGRELPKESTVSIKGNDNTVMINNYYQEAATPKIKLKKFKPRDANSFMDNVQEEKRKKLLVYLLIEIAVFILSIFLFKGYSFIVLIAEIGLFVNKKENLDIEANEKIDSFLMRKSPGRKRLMK
jgi:hypothetical protein